MPKTEKLFFLSRGYVLHSLGAPTLSSSFAPKKFLTSTSSNFVLLVNVCESGFLPYTPPLCDEQLFNPRSLLPDGTKAFILKVHPLWSQDDSNKCLSVLFGRGAQCFCL